MVKILIFSVLALLFGRNLYGQNSVYKIKDIDDYYFSGLVDNNQYEGQKIKIRFASIDSGNYFIINKLLYQNITGKAMAYFKEFDLYVVRSQKDLSYYTFNEAFPKGGFYKDGLTKLYFGQLAERYSLDNDVLDMKLWVVNGQQTNNNLVKEFGAMGILKNIPTGKNIVAMSVRNIEFELNEYVENKEKGSAKSYLEDVLVSFRDKEDGENDCKTKLYTQDTLSVTNYPLLGAKSFKYKISSQTRGYKNHRQEAYNYISNIYRNDDGSEILAIYHDEDSGDFHYFLYDNKNELVYELSLVDGKYGIKDVKKLKYDNCDVNFNLKKLETGKPTKTFYYGKKGKFEIQQVEIDDKNYPEMKNINFPNGFLVRQVHLGQYLDKNTVEATIEKGSFNFNLSQ